MFQPTVSSIKIAKNLALAAVLGTLTLAPLSAQETTPAPGAVYTATNAVDGNRVAIFDRAIDGTVTFSHTVATGGFGTGFRIGNQGAVTLSEDNRFLFAVNAGSDDLSVFLVKEDDLALKEIISSGGNRPVSVTQDGDLVFVANEDSDSIQGYRLDFNGQLTPIQGSNASLANADSGIAQIAFGPDGRSLYVTGRDTNTIDVFRLSKEGAVVGQRVIDSSGNVPFGFAFGNRGQLIVSEGGGLDGNGAVTSYDVTANGFLNLTSSSVTTTQLETCWVVIDPTGRLMFVSNTGSDTVSSYSIGFGGELTLINPVAASVGAGPRDMALTSDGRFFYVLDEQAGIIGDYVVGSDGSLVGIPGGTDLLEVGATGLAAR